MGKRYGEVVKWRVAEDRLGSKRRKVRHFLVTRSDESWVLIR
jgi:hypothetical protein